jgi:O-methyltransferase involved in polyketide biosynthesis
MALMHALADIPYCWELAGLMDAKKTADAVFGANSLRIAAALAPIMELRHRSISALMKQSDIKNILEIAAGFSTRGLEMTEYDPTIHYIESDLRPVLEEKKELIRQLMPFGQGKPKNLCFCAADALDCWQLERVADNFDDGPIKIITEGLLLYLNREEKERITKNLICLLKKSGGIWITTDISVKKRFIALDKENDIGVGLAKITQLTGRDFADIAFATEQEAVEFFATCGLKATITNQSSLIGLNELKSLKLDLPASCRQILLPLLQTAKIWTLELK